MQLRLQLNLTRGSTMKNKTTRTIILLIVCSFFTFPVFAYQITIGELESYVNTTAPNYGDNLDKLIASKIAEQLQSKNLVLALREAALQCRLRNESSGPIRGIGQFSVLRND